MDFSFSLSDYPDYSAKEKFRSADARASLATAHLYSAVRIAPGSLLLGFLLLGSLLLGFLLLGSLLLGRLRLPLSYS